MSAGRPPKATTMPAVAHATSSFTQAAMDCTIRQDRSSFLVRYFSAISALSRLVCLSRCGPHHTSRLRYNRMTLRNWTAVLSQVSTCLKQSAAYAAALVAPSNALLVIGEIRSAIAGMQHDEHLTRRWAHVCCANWLGQTFFVKVGKGELIEGVKPAEMAQTRTCSVCSARGVCVECAHKGCTTAFHARCIRTGGRKRSTYAA